MRIVRFIDDQGRTRFGEDAGNGTGLILVGDLLSELKRTDRRARIAKLLAPIVPTDIICIGRNYHPSPTSQAAAKVRSTDAAGPSGETASIPPQTDATLEVFLKPSTALQNPNDPILIPHFPGVDVQLDCEGELAVVIGKEARNVTEIDALNHVFGYTLANDVTARFFQTPAGPPIWMRGKGFDTFCPLGPAIITADELPDPGNLTIRTLINGQVAREGSTRDMIRSVQEIIAALSRHMMLRAGAVILTGAPAANQQVLFDGDIVSVCLEGMMTLISGVATAKI